MNFVLLKFSCDLYIFKLRELDCLLKVMRIIFSVIGAGLGAYALITDNFQVMPFMLFSLGAMMLVTGISELQEKRKTMAIISFLSAAFALFVCVYTFSTWVQ